MNYKTSAESKNAWNLKIKDHKRLGPKTPQTWLCFVSVVFIFFFLLDSLVLYAIQRAFNSLLMFLCLLSGRFLSFSCSFPEFSGMLKFFYIAG